MNSLKRSFNESTDQTDTHKAEQSKKQANMTTSDFIQLINPLDLIIDWLSNYEFYCLMPSLSQAHQSLMRDDSLHRRQCKDRLRMTQLQKKLFAQFRFPVLYVPLDKTVSIQRARYDVMHEKPTTNKIWWLECTRLFLHLSYATRYLTRHAPTHLFQEPGDHVAIQYELPQLLQSVLIDELTSFYVFNILTRYQDVRSFDTHIFESIKYDLDHIAKPLEPFVWQDYTDESEENEEEEFDLNYFDCQFNEISTERDARAIPFQWDMNNAEMFLPYIVDQDFRSWFLKGGMSRGNVMERELFRLHKFIYDDNVMQNWKHNPNSELTDVSPPRTKGYHYSCTAHHIEHNSHW